MGNRKNNCDFFWYRFLLSSLDRDIKIGFLVNKDLQDEFSITVLTVRYDQDLHRFEKIDKVSVIRSAYLFIDKPFKIFVGDYWRFS